MIEAIPTYSSSSLKLFVEFAKSRIFSVIGICED